MQNCRRFALATLGIVLVGSACRTPSPATMETARDTPSGALEIRQRPIVETSQGRLAGSVEDDVRRFHGIPFAGPPIGEARFRRAPAAPRWSGTRDATAFGPICPQQRYVPERGVSELVGDEDCLSLSVWAPDEAGGDRPVLVWIHGGGRRTGNGRRDASAFVQDTGAIVVMIQYRLAHLAFFAHPAIGAEDPSRLASGNYGFLDAIDALRWVRDEIRAFGGDPDRVTIGGLSGGGTMVCGLLAAPEAAGLFHGAIIQSAGGCWFPTHPIEAAEARGIETARTLGCDAGDERAVARCLRAQPVEGFFRDGMYLDTPFAPGSIEEFMARPIIGGSTGHFVDGSVFPRSWPLAYAAGTFHRVPTIVSVTEHEGRRVYAELLRGLGGPALGPADYVRALTGLTGTRALAERAARAFPLDVAGRSPAETFADVATEAHYTCPHAEMAQAIAPFTPTWLVEFRVPGSRANPELELGAYHGADTEMLFGYGFSGPIAPLDETQTVAAKRLRGYVANFMRRGDPNGEGLPSWPRHRATDGARHLDFGTAPAPAAGLRESSCRFWREAEWSMLP